MAGPPRQHLRPYQALARDALRAGAAAAIRRQLQARELLVAPTGAGKTSIAAAIIDAAVARGKRVWFVAHRRELIDQCSRRLDGQAVRHGVIMAGHARFDPTAPVQVCSVQTVARRDLPTLLALLGGPPDLIIVDEAHLARAASYAPFFDRFPGAVVIGLTATPWRLDGKGLGELFTHEVVAATPAELERQGFLATATGFAFDRPDLSGVSRRGADYQEDELERVMSATTITGNIVEKWQEHAEGRRTLGFAVNVAHSKLLAGQFRDAGVAAEHLDGAMPTGERRGILDRFESGKTRVLWNVNVLTAGYDCPLIETIILARPTASLALYLQMVGRGARPACRGCGRDVLTGAVLCGRCYSTDLKRRFRLHDHAGLVLEHGLPSADRDYTLTSDVQKTKRPRVGEEQAEPIRVCLGCYAMFPSDEPRCPACGWVKRVRRIEHVDGETISLEEAAERGRADRESRAFVAEGPAKRAFDELRAQAATKNYDKKWVTITFLRRMGFPPRREWWAA